MLNKAFKGCLAGIFGALLCLQITPSHSAELLSDADDNKLTYSARVIGGADADDGEWPSIVAIARPGPLPLADRFFCGGTLVADRYVMTAAHCLYDSFNQPVSPATLRVVAGVGDLENGDVDHEYVVTNIMIHPDYNHLSELPPADIALLEIANAPPIAKATLFTGESENYSGTPAYIVGWGATAYANESGFNYPLRLQDAQVPLVALSVCNQPDSYQGGVTARQLCAGYAAGGTDTCSGDSGGPVFILEGGKQLQVGITSFGNGCALANYYGIYTNVSHFIPWLSSYFTTPPQDPELARRRQEGVPPTTGGDSKGLFGAAVQPIMLFLFLLIGVARRLSAMSLNGRLWRVTGLFMAVGLLSGCLTGGQELSGAQAGQSADVKKKDAG